MSSLANVKEGDALAIYGRRFSDSLEKATVTRCTPSICYAGESAYQRKYGNRRGASKWSREYAEPWDEAKHGAELAEAAAQHRLRAARRKLSDFAWHTVSQNTADAVLRMLDGAKAIEQQKGEA